MRGIALPSTLNSCEAKGSPFWIVAPQPSGTRTQAESKRILDGLTAQAAEGQPGLDVVGVSVEGAPVEELIAAADEADLLVVGSRGEGGFKGLLLGSVSHQCALHAPCPVVIVR